MSADTYTVWQASCIPQSLKPHEASITKKSHNATFHNSSISNVINNSNSNGNSDSEKKQQR